MMTGLAFILQIHWGCGRQPTLQYRKPSRVGANRKFKNAMPGGRPIEMRTLAQDPPIFLLPNFLSGQEADEVVEAAVTKASWEYGKVFGSSGAAARIQNAMSLGGARAADILIHLDVNEDGFFDYVDFANIAWRGYDNFAYDKDIDHGALIAATLVSEHPVVEAGGKEFKGHWYMESGAYAGVIDAIDLVWANGETVAVSVSGDGVLSVEIDAAVRLARISSTDTLEWDDGSTWTRRPLSNVALPLKVAAHLAPRIHGHLFESQMKEPHRRHRHSNTTWLTNNALPVTSMIYSRAARVSGLPEALVNASGDLQIVHYPTTGHYGGHYDESLRNLQQGKFFKIATLGIFLNEPVRGGETVFPAINRTGSGLLGSLTDIEFKEFEARSRSYRHCPIIGGLHVQPRKGDAIFWYNVRPEVWSGSKQMTQKTHSGTEMMFRGSLHCGASVLEGEKWWANLWLRWGPEGLIGWSFNDRGEL